ncbi:MAG: hydantoinase/oxoprolinase family protein, partial [Micromonosporaceae bacterium]
GYGRGGAEPTVTDANLVLGVLEDGQRLGDDVVLDRAAAYAACARLGRTLGLDAVEVARGIRRISNAAMAGAVQAVSVGRGLDPRDFALLAFGGAGPMHAVDIAKELAIPTVVVPPAAGCLSALGLVVSDVVHDYAVSFPERLAPDLAHHLEAALGGLTGRAREQLSDEGFALAGQLVQPSLDMRYAGQNSSITVPIPGTGPGTGPDGSRSTGLDGGPGGGLGASGWLDVMAERFHQAHERVNGFRVADEPIDIVTARVRGTGQLARDPVALPTPTPGRPRASGVRLLRLADADQVEAPRYLRSDLTPGAAFSGPAIVESSDTTIVIPPRARADVDAYGNLLLHLEAV